jgi:lysozyme
LCSFCYNVGPNNLKGSTLLKKVNKDPNDLTIKDEFLKWNKSGGKTLTGLTIRRMAEAKLYFQS